VNFIGLSPVFRIFCIAITSANNAIPMLCGCTLRRTVLYVNKFLLQLRDRMIGRFRAGNGRRSVISRLNP